MTRFYTFLRDTHPLTVLFSVLGFAKCCLAIFAGLGIRSFAYHSLAHFAQIK